MKKSNNLELEQFRLNKEVIDICVARKTTHPSFKNKEEQKEWIRKQREDD